MAKHKYGEYSDEQFVNYKKRLHSLIHWLLIYAEQNKDILNDYFDYVQFKLNGLNELLNNSSYIIEIMNLVESSRLEYNSLNYSHKRYRKAILDIHELIDKLSED